MGIIIKPIVTEKMTKMAENKQSRFAFYVQSQANKIEIKKAVEGLYNVTVLDVNTLNTRGKKKSRYTKSGIISGTTPSYKKAIVTLKEGDTIDLILKKFNVDKNTFMKQNETIYLMPGQLLVKKK